MEDVELIMLINSLFVQLRWSLAIHASFSLPHMLTVSRNVPEFVRLVGGGGNLFMSGRAQVSCLYTYLPFWLGVGDDDFDIPYKHHRRQVTIGLYTCEFLW